MKTKSESLVLESVTAGSCSEGVQCLCASGAVFSRVASTWLAAGVPQRAACGVVQLARTFATKKPHLNLGTIGQRT